MIKFTELKKDLDLNLCFIEGLMKNPSHSETITGKRLRGQQWIPIRMNLGGLGTMTMAVKILTMSIPESTTRAEELRIAFNLTSPT